MPGARAPQQEKRPQDGARTALRLESGPRAAAGAARTAAKPGRGQREERKKVEGGP